MDPDFFYYGFARFGRTTLFEKWYGHGRTSRSGCYAPVLCRHGDCFRSNVKSVRIPEGMLTIWPFISLVQMYICK